MPAPEGSSVLSTVIVVFGAFGTISISVLAESSTSTSRYTVELSRERQYRYRRTFHVQSRAR